MIKPLHKAVFVLGFASADRPGGGPVAGADDSAAVRRAVKEALAAGLKELIFVTPDSLTPVETQFGDVGNGKAERVVVARQFAAGNLGEALCGIRHLLDEEPFALFVPGDTGSGLEEDVTARLLASSYDHGGNPVADGDHAVLQREGRFAAIAAAPAGSDVMHPLCLNAVAEYHDSALAAASTLVPREWRVTKSEQNGS